MYIKIHLRPDAKDDSFKVINSELYEISVRAPAERGLANQRLLEILREHHPNVAVGNYRRRGRQSAIAANRRNRAAYLDD